MLYKNKSLSLSPKPYGDFFFSGHLTGCFDPFEGCTDISEYHKTIGKIADISIEISYAYHHSWLLNRLKVEELDDYWDD